MKPSVIAAAAGTVALAAAIGLATREHDPVERGRAYAMEGKREKAFGVWAKACAAGGARSCAAAGAAHLSEGETDLAREMSARADAIDPKALESLLLRAGLALIDERRAEAREIYGEAETLHPYSGLPSANLAMMALEDDDLDGAREYANRSTTVNPNLGMGYAVRARIMRELGYPVVATEAYRIAVSLDPSNPHYKMELADSLRGDESAGAERERLLRDAAAALPDDMGVRIAWGQALAESGRTDEAIDVLRAAADAAKDRVEPHLLLAEIFLDQGNASFAEARLKAALEIDPENVDAALLLVDALVNQQRYDDALAALDAFIAREDVHEDVRLDVRMQRARILAQLGRNALAKKDVAALLAKSPEDYNGNYLLAHILVEEKRYAEAATHLDVALAQNPTDPRSIFDRARILAGTGKHDDAVAELKALASIVPLRPDEVKAQPEFAALASRRDFRLLLEGVSETEPAASPTP